VIQANFAHDMTSVRVELDELLRGGPDHALRQPGIGGEWSCADILAHFAGYTRGVADGLAKARGSVVHRHMTHRRASARTNSTPWS
jgi:hypothetical protein